ncbi:MAG: GNAT family N-acetyltransferase [Actinomycetota bacterium]|nr:GNAT family N-acetyltransferase [Actinomycetota bacterium]
MAEHAPPLVAHHATLRVEHHDDDCCVLTALDQDGSVVGLASGGASRDDDAPTAWELYTINVQQPSQGSGLAHDLLVEVLGDRPASVWVLTANGRAQSFYRRHGFLPDGATRPHEGSGAPEQRMVRTGAPPSGSGGR